MGEPLNSLESFPVCPGGMTDLLGLSPGVDRLELGLPPHSRPAASPSSLTHAPSQATKAWACHLCRGPACPPQSC